MWMVEMEEDGTLKRQIDFLELHGAEDETEIPYSTV